MENTMAQHIMVRSVTFARPWTSARHVVSLQLLHGLYSGVPVIDSEGQVIGMVTEFDLLKAVVEKRELAKTTAGEIMSTVVITAGINTPVSELMKIMTAKNIGRIPITERGKLVGVVARCDVLKSLVEPEFTTYFSEQRPAGENLIQANRSVNEGKGVRFFLFTDEAALHTASDLLTLDWRNGQDSTLIRLGK